MKLTKCKPQACQIVFENKSSSSTGLVQCIPQTNINPIWSFFEKKSSVSTGFLDSTNMVDRVQLLDHLRKGNVETGLLYFISQI